MKSNELKTKPAQELRDLDKKLREELFALRLKNTTAQLEKKSQIRQVRRDIARVQTFLTKAYAQVAAK